MANFDAVVDLVVEMSAVRPSAADKPTPVASLMKSAMFINLKASLRSFELNASARGPASIEALAKLLTVAIVVATFALLARLHFL